jgi:MFS family permease
MAILGLTAVSAMNDMVIITVAGNLYQDFANINIAVLNYILSGPILITAIFSLIGGRLIYFSSKKTLITVAFGVFTVASILGDAIHNAYYMVVMRTLVGASVGIIGVCAISIITDVFIDEKARGSMMGIYNAMMTIIGAALGWASGLVGINSWRMVYRIYLISIPIFILIILFLPKDPVSQGRAGGIVEDAAVNTEKMPWKKLLPMEFAYMVYNITYCVVFYQISMIVTAKGIGDVSLIGILAALGTVGSFVACAAFGLYFNKLKRFTIAIGYAGMALCYWALYGSGNAPVMAIACTLLGATFGTGVSYYMMYSTMIVPAVHMPMSISVTTAAMGIGSFLSTYCSTFLQALIKAKTILEIIPILIIVLIVGAVLSLTITLVERKKAIPQAE